MMKKEEINEAVGIIERQESPSSKRDGQTTIDIHTNRYIINFKTYKYERILCEVN
jgi:hypothetical protein